MRTISFEPGDGSFEVVVDHRSEILPSDWTCPATSILLKEGREYRILKCEGVIRNESLNGF